MDKPTDEQIKEFWERYRYTGKLESIKDIGEGEGKLVYVSPPIDLNNLFKHAVPKYIAFLLESVSEQTAYEMLFERWLELGHDATALFWTLQEIRNARH